jgi:hypothetical protein
MENQVLRKIKNKTILEPYIPNQVTMKASMANKQNL